MRNQKLDPNKSYASCGGLTAEIKPRRRLTSGGWTLSSLVLVPPIIVGGGYLTDHGHPYLGVMLLFYGIIGGMAAMVGGMLHTTEHGFTEEIDS